MGHQELTNSTTLERNHINVTIARRSQLSHRAIMRHMIRAELLNVGIPNISPRIHKICTSTRRGTLKRNSNALSVVSKLSNHHPQEYTWGYTTEQSLIIAICVILLSVEKPSKKPCNDTHIKENACMYSSTALKMWWGSKVFVWKMVPSLSRSGALWTIQFRIKSSRRKKLFGGWSFYEGK